MKKIAPQLICFIVLLGVFLSNHLFQFSEFSYLDFLSHKYVLNIVVIGLALAVGYFNRNYLITLAGTSFVLMVYLLAFIFEPKEVISALFFAIYTVFLGVAALANLLRIFRDRKLANEYSLRLN